MKIIKKTINKSKRIVVTKKKKPYYVQTFHNTGKSKQGQRRISINILFL